MFSATCDIGPVITGSLFRSGKRHIVYIDNPCETIIIIIIIYFHQFLLGGFKMNYPINLESFLPVFSGCVHVP